MQPMPLREILSYTLNAFSDWLVRNLRNPDIAISSFGFIRRRQQDEKDMRMLIPKTEDDDNGTGNLPLNDKVLWASLFVVAFVLFLIVGV